MLIFFCAAPGARAGGRVDMAVQPLIAKESKYNGQSEGDSGSRCEPSKPRVNVADVEPEKEGFTPIPPGLADMASRPTGRASRRRADAKCQCASAAPSR